jgi:hypothetical protein
MKKNRSKRGVAIRFTEKLVNCNALFYCAQKFLSYGGKKEHISKKEKINRRNLLKATVKLFKKQVLIRLYGTMSYGCIYPFKVAVTFSNQFSAPFSRGLHG